MTRVLEVPVDGATLHVEATGPEDAPRVALLHGALAAGRSLLGQAAAIKSRYHALLVDQRGHGASTRFGVPGNGWERQSVEQLVDDALALADALDVDAWVGASLGGIVAANVAAARPGRVRALALLATPPEPSGARAEFFGLAEPESFPKGQQDLWARWHGHDYWRELAARTFRAFASRRADAYARERLLAYSGPALVLQGADDALVRAEEAGRWRAWLPHADVRVVPGDHAFFAGAGRREANEALLAFLDRSFGGRNV